MIAFTSMAAFFAGSPPELSREYRPGHTAVALLIVVSVLGAAVVTETIRHRNRRRVHHPVPLPARRVPAPVVIKERRGRDLARSTELVAHRS
ncbi:MHYT domain-containing protein [Stackebrandtia nassauensis]|uniref:Uncharacterized protein n=1 Tax=Stackebrandtia nassauensis (strain DSM 44728 / CIP 108903 / NRRL B-16338 / NBRC 102104 / LLR-40K-21) TaxID=446470 RepID=D3Q677_STANL|nr:MHYT domain-containing protein [Stackebrandtia nassauensis]ADD42252.1 hypothetical protein Snas_2572 [Stackebrandtia nassauensis DSM 44728]